VYAFGVYQLGQLIHDRYEVSGILEPLALGQLYRAIQRKGGMHVFLWVVGPRLLPDQGSRQRFVQALSRAYGARHPNVLPMCDLFIERNDVVLALQYLEGPTLGVFLEQRRATGPLARGEAWSLIEQVGSAVSQFHQLGMVIAALRPETLLVTSSGVMLRDPGVAMSIPRARFLDAIKHGRAWSWLAPEVREKRAVDLHADVYSLAAVAHLILYGSPHPWPDGTRRGLFAKMGRRLRFGARPRRPQNSWPLVDAVLARALEGHPRARPFDVETLLGQVQAALYRSPDRPAPVAAAPVPKSAGARTVQMEASGPANLPAPPAAPPAPARTMMAPTPSPAPAPTMMAPSPAPAPTMMAPSPSPAPAPTMMAPSPSPAPAPAPTMMAPSPSPAPAPTMMAPSPSPSPAPTMTAPSPSPAPPPQEPGVMTIDAELPPSAMPMRGNTTRQLDSNEINSLLQAESRAELNKTREVNTAEIEALLAASREDPPKKP
jgi:serine/threonine protein kinase